MRLKLGTPFVLALSLFLSSPALAQQESVRWNMVTTWPSALPGYTFAEDFANRVEQMSGGRMIIDVHPAGAIVGAFEVLDAVDTGIVEMGHAWSGYWLGMHPAAPFFGAIPASLEPAMYNVWLFEAGGIEMWNRLYQEVLNLNVVVMPVAFAHAETFSWSNRPLRTIEDFQGLRFRSVGWWADILREAGVSVVSMPMGEVYQSLERGVIDAAEFSTPWVDRTSALYEVTRYLTGPGIHQPASVLELIINRDQWESLPEDLQAIVTGAAEATMLRSWAMDIINSMDAIDYYVEQGLEVVTLEPETQRAIRELVYGYLDEQAAADAFFAEVWDSVRSFYDRYVDYEELMMPLRR